jgi:hypothetical protein
MHHQSSWDNVFKKNQKEKTNQKRRRIMADKNGDGIVYHRSDCSLGYVRWYGLGGDAPGSTCETWGLSDEALQYIHDHPETNHRAEDIWAISLAPVIIDIGNELKKGYEKVETGVIDAYNWVDANACNLAVTAAISAGAVALFTPAQPEGAATSTTLSIMAQPVLWASDKALKVTVVAGMSTIIKDAFLLIPEVANSIDETLLYNVISNCLAVSLDSAELWATPLGVGAAIAAAFAPVIAELVCNKTCPEGFTKAFGS